MQLVWSLVPSVFFCLFQLFGLLSGSTLRTFDCHFFCWFPLSALSFRVPLFFVCFNPPDKAFDCSSVGLCLFFLSVSALRTQLFNATWLVSASSFPFFVFSFFYFFLPLSVSTFRRERLKAARLVVAVLWCWRACFWGGGAVKTGVD